MIEIEPDLPSTSSSPTFSMNTPTLVKTVCKTMSAGGTALCCSLHPLAGCALHVAGEVLGVVNDAVEKNVNEHEESQKQEKIMEALLRTCMSDSREEAKWPGELEDVDSLPQEEASATIVFLFTIFS